MNGDNKAVHEMKNKTHAGPDWTLPLPFCSQMFAALKRLFPSTPLGNPRSLLSDFPYATAVLNHTPTMEEAVIARRR